MKIVEGLKRLQSIERRIHLNNKNINKYSSIISCERPVFNTIEEQKLKLNELILENLELCQEYLKLKNRIDLTNNTILLTINDQSRTINEFLTLKRKIGNLIISTYENVNDSYSQKRFKDFRGDNIQIQQLYDENQKLNNINYWYDILEQIDGKLEVHNAITDILD